MRMSLRVAFASSLLVAAAAACASTNRNSALGTGSDTCMDIDSDCRTSSDCCSGFCANHVCVKRDR